MADYHIHTYLCGHASGEPFEYVEHAIKIGLKEIGFSDHAPMVSHDDPTVTMSKEQLPFYHDTLEILREKYKDQIEIKIGIEADFIPGYEEKTKKILAAYPYDYVIGSVHYIGDWGFDNSNEKQKLAESNINDVYRKYYNLLRLSAKSGMFDIMAHVDLVKKFGHYPTENLKEEVENTSKVFKDSGVAIELNTSGLRKPAREMYPSALSLKIYAQADVPLVFGSDSHQPEDVGKDFIEAIRIAKKVGYKEFLTFKNRKIEKRVPLS